MRPQAAMGAVLLLMLGSSLLFLRARPEKSAASARLSVIERGVPDRRDEPLQAPAPQSLATAELRLVNERHRDPDERVERALVARRGSASAMPKQALAAGEPPESENLLAMQPAADAAPEADHLSEKRPPTHADAYAAAMALYESGNYAEAARELELIAGSGTAQAPLAALYAAKSVEAASGCDAAASRYEAVARRFAKASLRGDALVGAASCRKALGHWQRARELLVELREVAGFRDRADQELAKLEAMTAE